MRRKQFTFYRSFLDAILALPKKEQLPFALALITYALDGEELPLSGSAASAICIVKPLLDSSRRKAESGSLGGKQTKSKPQANTSKVEANGSKRKQTEFCLSEPDKQEKEQVKEQVKEQDKDEDEAPPTPLPGGSAVGVVVGAVGKLSQQARAELYDYVGTMGEECVSRAVNAALDAGKPTWGYIRGILDRKLHQGVRSAEDWDKAEASFQAAKGGGTVAGGRKIAGTPRDVQPSPERAKQNSDWLEEFLKQQEG